MKAHPTDKIESITIVLDEEKFPSCYKNKLAELIECGMTEEEARKFLNTAKFEMEIYYEKGLGLFLVESEALEGGTIYSPYSLKQIYTDEDPEYDSEN